MEVNNGPGTEGEVQEPKKTGQMLEGPVSSSKKRKIQKVIPGLIRNERNLILKSQKVLTERVLSQGFVMNRG